MEKRTETFEEYGIKIPYRRRNGNVKCVCPNCKTSGRTHPEDRSLSVNLDTGLWHCHYCGWSGGLKGYEGRRPEKRRSYNKPKPLEEHGLSQKLINYWSLRGISLDTLKKMHITEGMEFMPQVGKEMNTVQFPYYLEGELINVKYRTGDKKFKMTAGAELIPYNIDGIKDKETALIVEGECFDEKAQVLTQRGWVKINSLTNGDVVAQWENGLISFAKPLAIVKKPYKGDLVEISKARKNYYSLTTPHHNLVVERGGRVSKLHAEDINSQINVPRSGYSNGPGLPLCDDYLRLLVMISADFTLREKGDIYGSFKKKRKVERAKYLLEKLGIRHNISEVKDGYTSIFIHRGGVEGAFKEFPMEWLYLANAKQIQIILQELVLWDGNSVSNRTMKEYSSKLYHNAVWVQTLCHLGGMMSTICHRKNQHGEWYKVSMLFKDRTSIMAKHKKRIFYDGTVYCCTMPAGTLLVRQNDCITVSGNCDALSFIEAGIDNVISVPNGANANLEWLDDFLEGWFDDKQTIYLAVDNDEKGLQLREELVRRFGAERCMIVEWSQGCKDANDQLKSFGAESLRNCITGAHEVKVGGIYSLADYESDLDTMWREGLQRGKTIGHENFDRLISFETKRLLIVTGVPSSGKSEFIDEMVVRLNVRYGWKAAFFSPENLPMKYHASKIIEKLTGKKFSESTMSAVEYEAAKHYYSSNFKHILPEEKYTLDAILDKAKFLVRRNGIKVLVIDPYNRIESDIGTQSETNYISKILDQLTNFAQRNDVLVCLMAHPRKINKSENADGIPTFYDINGSANFYNKADFGLIVHRNRDEGYTLVRVAKVKFRHLGENGDALFKYNVENGRYTPFMDGQPCVFDNRSFLYDDSSQPQAQQQPITPESNYDFLSDVGDDCPF